MSRRMVCQCMEKLGLVLLVVLSVAAAGCSTRGSAPGVYRETASVPNRQVTLSPGDVIELKFYYAPDLNETQAVRPDGKVMLQLVGLVQAEGLTPEQLQADLKERYRKFIEKTEVAVMVRTLQSRAVYVGGSVVTPGKVDMPGNLTVLNAIMQAGGFKEEVANVANVIVVRTEGGKQVGFSLDLESVLKGGPETSFYLHPMDVVYVPRNTIVDVDDWISQHFYKLLPQLGFFISVGGSGN
jgi:protein involved in polysaccharide export with SLBB domain